MSPKKRLWPRLLIGVLGLAILGGFVFALFSARRLEGAVPTDTAVLGLGVLDGVYLVGSEEGAFVSREGRSWDKVKSIGRRRVLVSSNSRIISVLSSSVILTTRDGLEFKSPAGVVQSGVAIGTDGDGNHYIAEKSGGLTLLSVDNAVSRIEITKGPSEIIAIDALPGDPVTLFAGGLSSGFWKSETGGARWRHILKTPTRAVLVDPDNSNRVFIGTAGGVLVSTDGGLTWNFTEFRKPVESLAGHDGDLFAVTDERLLFRSPNGTSDWERVGG